ncbi:MarR family winged helix-turn-helix transcriptional regulator [Kocuria tytonis]|uniref:MarR family transcriptional regulator n=1 Tax=Kocuria tytonis TaxID=2054280 RepID=A0A495A551_9MICC|nr:MarR family winged helix-turn-helix transcriptional regulator [Kocuria tytonis]RKQ34871.1 MarR family transcriptional regulator [Kocuria tytonis]
MSSSSNEPPVPWLSAAEQEVWRNFLRLSRGMERAVDRQLQRDSELSGSEYDILVPLSEAASGELPSRELLRGLGWERSRLSHMLSRMERRDMLRRSPSPTDGRGLVVAITDHGREAIGRAAPAHLAMVREALVDHLSQDEKSALLSIARKVLPRLAAMGLA